MEEPRLRFGRTIQEQITDHLCPKCGGIVIRAEGLGCLGVGVMYHCGWCFRSGFNPTNLQSFEELIALL